MGRANKDGLFRYVIDGEAVFLPKRTEEEQRLHRLAYNKQWVRDNQVKVQNNMKKHLEYKERVRLGLE